MIKLPISGFEFRIGVLRIGDWGSTIENWGRMHMGEFLHFIVDVCMEKHHMRGISRIA